MPEVSKTVPDARGTSPVSAAPVRRASSSSGGEDPGGKRQKFLERNRYVLSGLWSHGFTSWHLSILTHSWPGVSIHRAEYLNSGSPQQA
jgi:hypothetical protein